MKIENEPVATVRRGAAALALADANVRAAVASFRGAGSPTWWFAAEIVERGVEYEAITDLLLAHTTPGADVCDAEMVARAIAAGCLGERHLWRDMGLPNRRALRGLLEAYFEPFAADNVMDMRWKKFVYRRLCRWGGFNTCSAPSCTACADYEDCFGPSR